jgi:hypothetical protein
MPYGIHTQRARPPRARLLGVVVGAAAIALAACGGSSSPSTATSATVASLPTSGGNGNSGSTATGSGRSATTRPKGNPTALLDEWATCMHSHGDPNQVDPTVDAYGVINITIPTDAQDLSGAVHGGTDPCNRSVAAAQSALRAAHPVAAPPDQAEGLKYVNCMRANGVPKYPYATGNTTNFNGTGVDPNSPFVENVNTLCGNKLRLPPWWISGTGPPGDVVVRSGPNGGPPSNFAANNRPRPAPGGNGGAGDNSGSGAGG